jgi:ATP-independent RNA helicase DbpA
MELMEYSGFMKTFTSLGLHAESIAALERISYTEMTPIQEESLPIMLFGLDVAGQAMTGSGKTAAFGLALLHNIDVKAVVQAMVLCPTRELAEQVATEIRRLAQCHHNIRVVTLCGGKPNREQVQALEKGVQIVIGTPGRIGKHIRTGKLKLDALRVLVLDEADRMLDMGFMDEVDEIVDQCPKKRQTLLFSATFPEKIEELSDRVQTDPQIVRVQSLVKADKLQQLVFECSDKQRPRHQLIANLLGEYRPETALIFCETRMACNNLSDFLNDHGALSLTLHGEMEQRDRDDVLLQFSNGSASVLVATNLAARGIDIPDLAFVLIAELSQIPEDHLHRIGRTGRAGKSGVALSLVAPREGSRLELIEELLGSKIEEGTAPKVCSDLNFLRSPNRTVLILSGRRDKIRKGDVMGSLVKDAKIPAEAIGRIDLMSNACAVAIKQEYVQKAVKHFRNGRIKKKKVRVQLL